MNHNTDGQNRTGRAFRPDAAESGFSRSRGHRRIPVIQRAGESMRCTMRSASWPSRRSRSGDKLSMTSWRT